MLCITSTRVSHHWSSVQDLPLLSYSFNVCLFHWVWVGNGNGEGYHPEVRGGSIFIVLFFQMLFHCSRFGTRSGSVHKPHSISQLVEPSPWICQRWHLIIGFSTNTFPCLHANLHSPLNVPSARHPLHSIKYMLMKSFLALSYRQWRQIFLCKVLAWQPRFWYPNLVDRKSVV